MTSERWRRIEALFHDARAHVPEAREAFLRDACGGDRALEQEVRSLLGQDVGTLFQDGLAGAAAAVTRRAPHVSLDGRRLGPYVLGTAAGRGRNGARSIGRATTSSVATWR